MKPVKHSQRQYDFNAEKELGFKYALMFALSINPEYPTIRLSKPQCCLKKFNPVTEYLNRSNGSTPAYHGAHSGSSSLKCLFAAFRNAVLKKKKRRLIRSNRTPNRARLRYSRLP